MRAYHKFAAGLAIATALPFPAVARLSASAWEIGPVVRGRNSSIGMPSAPQPVAGGGVAFEFPVAGQGEMHALTTTVQPLAGARVVTVRYRVDVARGTRFVAVDTPTEPATISLYLQRRNDSWSGKGQFTSHRWYSAWNAVLPITPGVHTIRVRFDALWTNVQGQPVSQDRDGYIAALEDTARVGIAFGSSTRRSHGVYATGHARFTLLGFDVS